MTLSVLNGPTIEAGESLSAPVDCSAGQLVRITAPPEWTPANVSFQISTDGVFFNDYFDRQGREIMIAIVPGAAIGFDLDFSRPVVFIKFRSGSRTNPIAQETRRDFAVAIELDPTLPQSPAVEGPAREDPIHKGRTKP